MAFETVTDDDGDDDNDDIGDCDGDIASSSRRVLAIYFSVLLFETLEA